MIVTRRDRVYNDDGETYLIMITEIITPDEVEGMAERAKDYGDGYDIGRKVQLGGWVPHPNNRRHPENFYHGMRAALGGRGLDISMFLQVIERKN